MKTDQGNTQPTASTYANEMLAAPAKQIACRISSLFVHYFSVQ